MKTDTIIWVVLAILVISPAARDMVSDTIGGLGLGGGAPSALDEFCQVEDVTVTLNDIDRGVPSTDPAIAAGNITYWINGDAGISNVADDGTFTASPGDTIKVLFGSNGTQIDSSNYTSTLVTKTLECRGTETIEGKVWQQANVTVYTKNDDGQVNGAYTTANGQAIGANDVIEIELNIKGESDKAAGLPADAGLPDSGLVVVLSAGTGTEDNYTKITLTGDGVESTSLPSFYTTAASTDYWAYEIPAIIDDATYTTYGLKIEAAGNDPAEANITVQVYDKAAYLDRDTGLPDAGVEDDNGNNVGDNGVTYTQLIHMD
jgi:hypothetical protein